MKKITLLLFIFGLTFAFQTNTALALPVGTTSTVKKEIKVGPVKGKAAKGVTKKQKNKEIKKEKRIERLKKLADRFKLKKENKKTAWGMPLLIIGVIVFLVGIVVGLVFHNLGYLISLAGLIIVIVALLQMYDII